MEIWDFYGISMFDETGWGSPPIWDGYIGPIGEIMLQGWLNGHEIGALTNTCLVGLMVVSKGG